MRAFGDKGNRSASPHALSISKANKKGSRNHQAKTQMKNKSKLHSEHHTFNAGMLSKKGKFEYLHSNSLNKANLNRTANKTELGLKKLGDSPHFGKNNIAALKQMGIYQNKTFYTVNQPKRAGTTLTNYLEEAGNKRNLKKRITKMTVTGTSNSTANAMYHNQSKGSSLKGKGQLKIVGTGDDKMFSLNEVLNQARIDQASNNQTLDQAIKNIDKQIVDFSRTNELQRNEKSLTYDDAKAFINEQKRESLPQHKRGEVLASSYVKKANSS